MRYLVVVLALVAGTARAAPQRWAWTWTPSSEHELRESCRATGSPLLRFRIASRTTPSGLVVVLSPLAKPRELLKGLQCYRWRAPESSLGVAELRIDATGDGHAIVLAIRARDPAELQRRFARELAAIEIADRDN